MKSEIYISTYSGIKFNLFNPAAEDVNIEDISHALSNICRFNGHSSRFFSVAQHCLIVSHLLMQETTRLMLLGLLHDAHEAYIGDMPTPVKRLLNVIIQGDEFENALSIVKSSLDNAIYERFQIELPTEAESSIIKTADNSSLVMEAKELGIRIDDSHKQRQVYKINDINEQFIKGAMNPKYFSTGPIPVYISTFNKLMKLNFGTAVTQ